MTTFAGEGGAYAKLVTDRPVEQFLRRFFLSTLDFNYLVLVSPIIGALRGTRHTLYELVSKIDDDRILTYVITCPPAEGDQYHAEAIRILWNSPFVEIRYNCSLHAKLYVCTAKELGFGLVGSGNLTPTSIIRNIEVGVMVSARGPGRDLVHQLYHWGAVRLRTSPDSRLVKRIVAKERS